jgi:hypothetical protein
MSSQFQIVFRGEILDGFELAAVQASAQRRLKAPPEQLVRVFSGKRVVLKKGLTDELATRYAAELQRVGMSVSIEPETVKVTTSAPVMMALDPIGAIDPVFSSSPVKNEPQRVTSRDEPAFDPMKTHLSTIPLEDEPPPPERWSQPTIAVSQKHLSSTQPTIASAPYSDDSSAPTLIVPPRKAGASDPTIVVSRGSSASTPAAPTISSSFAPTMIVPTRTSDEASEPTMIVPPRRGSSSEPTMIVPSARSAASEPTMIVPPRASSASQPTVIVRSNQKLPAAGTGAEAKAESFDAERTLLSSTASIDEYLAQTSDTPSARTPSSTATATVAPADEPEVQCPTCGDKQPKRVYCRRCGHALQLPPKPPVGDSTVTITKRPFPRPPLTPQVATPATPEETVLIEDTPEPEKKSAARKGFLAAPTWLTIGLMFVLLLAAAAWLIFS